MLLGCCLVGAGLMASADTWLVVSGVAVLVLGAVLAWVAGIHHDTR